MIRLPDTELDSATLARLAKYQKLVDDQPTFAAQVEEAKAKFKSYNTTDNNAFIKVRAALDGMCFGSRRCCYCEDSVADEVEHIRPKHWYPNLAFVWMNYLYACGPCNGPKGAKFAIFGKRNKIIELTDAIPHDAIPIGDPLLIDPRTEDPLDFLELDLEGAFRFLPRFGLKPRDIKRATYIIDLLRLNDRDVLVRARKNAFGSYRSRLVEYQRNRDRGGTEEDLQALIADLKASPHPTVWAEMKRQATSIPELDTIFTAVPEAMGW